jgi:pilus assembly protein FimV
MSTMRNTTLAWALALAVGASIYAGSAQAARLGHARVVSAPGAPLQVVVPLLDLAPDEAANLQVSLADAAAWQQAGLNPPTPLADTSATLEQGVNGTRVVRVSSTQPSTTDAIDVLLDLRSNAGQRLLQVTVLVPSGSVSAGIQRASTGGAQAGGSAGQVQVRPGDALWNVASGHVVAGANIYQELVALWRANPQAFIQNNMNLVRAGSTLTLPDDATVRAVDPNEAYRIFTEQSEAFRRYRGRLGAAAPGTAPVRGRGGAAGKVGSAASSAGAAAASSQDQLRLSAASNAAEAKADAQASARHALEDAGKRVDTLKSNVEALNQAGGATGAAAGSNAPGSTESGNAAQGTGTAGSTPAPGANAGSQAGATTPSTGASPETASPSSANSQSGQSGSTKDGMPSWLYDNLLAIVTAVLAVIIFVVAWALRRAGQRRSEDEDAFEYSEPSGATGHTISGPAIDDKLKTIDLDLDKPPTDEPSLGSRP